MLYCNYKPQPQASHVSFKVSDVSFKFCILFEDCYFIVWILIKFSILLNFKFVIFYLNLFEIEGLLTCYCNLQFKKLHISLELSSIQARRRARSQFSHKQARLKYNSKYKSQPPQKKSNLKIVSYTQTKTNMETSYELEKLTCACRR